MSSEADAGAAAGHGAPVELRVVVGVLTWRAEETTRTCLDSLRSIGNPWPVVVIDNGSGTGEGARLAHEFEASVVNLPTNGGVAAGYNAALRWACERGGVTHVLLANNDLKFDDPGLFTRLAAHAHPNVAAVGPAIRDVSGSPSSVGSEVSEWIGHVRRRRSARYAGAHEVDAVEGSCVLVSLEAVRRIGGLAPEFFLYWEETDWCARARQAAMRVIVEPSTSVTHVGIGSGNLRQTRRYALRNSLLYIRRNIHGAPGFTAALTWWFGKVPFFLVRRLLERANPVGVLQDAAWAISFHVVDVARRGWRIQSTGPDLCG